MATEGIQVLREKIHMTQRQFSAFSGIPLGTLRNWEQGLSNPPTYVYDMVIARIRRDAMINIETVKFMKMLENLAELSANGIVPFGEATDETMEDKVFYDEKTDENGQHRVVLDACLFPDHHDIVSYYDSCTDAYTVRVVHAEDKDEDGQDNYYVEVKTGDSDENAVVIEDGIWYFS